MGVTAPHHGPYDFSCRRSHHGSLERASVVLSIDARLHWLCCALSFLFCCVSPSNLPVKFCHTVNSELPWFQKNLVGYQLLVEKFIRRDDPCGVPVLLFPHILQWSGFSL